MRKLGHLFGKEKGESRFFGGKWFRVAGGLPRGYLLGKAGLQGEG